MAPVESVPVIILRLVNAEQLRHLMLIDEQDVGGCHQFRRQRRRERRIVEQHLHTRLMADARGGGHRLDRTFEAQAEHGRTHQRLAYGFHIIHGHLCVGARRIHDGVLAGRIHGDHGGSARTEHAAHMRGVHTGLGQSAEQEFGIAVGANRAEHLHGGADSRGRSGLIA